MVVSVLAGGRNATQIAVSKHSTPVLGLIFLRYAQVPADTQNDHIRWELKPSEADQGGRAPLERRRINPACAPR
jgi:hypothetical protein